MRKEVTYISDDGYTFHVEEECLKHEEYLKTRKGALLNPMNLRKKIQFFNSAGREIRDPENGWSHVVFISVHEKDQELFDIINAIDTKFMGYSHRNPFPAGKELVIPTILHFQCGQWEDFDTEIEHANNSIKSAKGYLEDLLSFKKEILEASLKDGEFK